MAAKSKPPPSPSLARAHSTNQLSSMLNAPPPQANRDDTLLHSGREAIFTNPVRSGSCSISEGGTASSTAYYCVIVRADPDVRVSSSNNEVWFSAICLRMTSRCPMRREANPPCRLPHSRAAQDQRVATVLDDGLRFAVFIGAPHLRDASAWRAKTRAGSAGPARFASGNNLTSAPSTKDHLQATCS
jgi:hypothetical protein